MLGYCWLLFVVFVVIVPGVGFRLVFWALGLFLGCFFVIFFLRFDNDSEC